MAITAAEAAERNRKFNGGPVHPSSSGTFTEKEIAQARAQQVGMYHGPLTEEEQALIRDLPWGEGYNKVLADRQRLRTLAEEVE